VAWIAAQPLSSRGGKPVAAALGCGLAGAVISVGLQGIDAFGLSLSDLKQPQVWASGLATSYGLTAVIAAGALIVGLVALRSSARGGAMAHPARFPLGHYRFAYQLRGQFDRPSLTRLRDMLASAEVRFSWPHWPVYTREELRPAPVDDTIECWLGRRENAQQSTPDELDYWRVSPAGKAYSIRGLNEDSHSDLVQPGTGLDISAPTRRLADGLTHAWNLAQQLGMQAGQIDFDLLWAGLANRRLVSNVNPNRLLWSVYRTRQPQYQRRFSVLAENLTERLPEIVDAALRPMYETFDFFSLPADLATREIAAWRRGN
jgi:hypothetical protein